MRWRCLCSHMSTGYRTAHFHVGSVLGPQGWGRGVTMATSPQVITK